MNSFLAPASEKQGVQLVLNFCGFLLTDQLNTNKSDSTTVFEEGL